MLNTLNMVAGRGKAVLKINDLTGSHRPGATSQNAGGGRAEHAASILQSALPVQHHFKFLVRDARLTDESVCPTNDAGVDRVEKPRPSGRLAS
jgi:hypothetical protein